MKKILLIFTLFSFTCSAQNLVPNPSFEDTVQCPIGVNVTTDQMTYATGWHKATAGTPDYFNSCNTGMVGVPQNFIGWEYAKSGVAYAGLCTANKGNPGPNYREYIQTRLTDSLIAGKKYHVSFYVSLADSVGYACNNIGAYFSPTAISSFGTSNFSYIPQIANTPANPLTKKNGWTIVADTFTAAGGELYITIGNFNDGAHSDTVFVGGAPIGDRNTSYYYIDDISVTHVDTAAGINEISNREISIFPNPATSEITVNSEQQTVYSIEIYNILGERIYCSPITDYRLPCRQAGSPASPRGEPFTLNISSFPAGMYFVEIKSEKGIGVKKFIKQ
jgi:hypothetical protein